MASAAQAGNEAIDHKSGSVRINRAKVSNGAAAVGAAMGAVVGFVIPFPGAISLTATMGGFAGKVLGERLAHEDTGPGAASPPTSTTAKRAKSRRG